jgi:hypothetical protein
MAAPNILTIATLTGKTALSTLTTATGNIITNSAASNTVNKLNEVVITNYTSSNITANVMLNRSSTAFFLAGNISIPSFSALVVVAKDTQVYMEEGDVLQANVSANSAGHIYASYEIMAT